MVPVNSSDSSNTAHGSRTAGCTVWTAALSKLRTVRRAEDGVAALEFALFAPILFLSLLAMVDLGLALHERMTIDHVLRAGAQTAMSGGDEAAVLKVIEATAAKNFSGDAAIALTVEEKYFCREGEVMVEVADPSTTCPGPTATSIYYVLTGLKSYDGILLDDIALAPSVQVQRR